jgi:hypothetical protein
LEHRERCGDLMRSLKIKLYSDAAMGTFRFQLLFCFFNFFNLSFRC